ncbi:MAG: hypothetical protein ABIO24_09630, partial [Saprospiraceae bacterium]
KIFAAVESGGLTKQDFQHPSNIYSFLEFQNGDLVQRITWGDDKYPVDEKIKTVFAQLNELIKK